MLQLEKSKGADFKYNNSIFKILVQKYQNKTFLVKNIPIRHFLVANVGIFVFFVKFEIGKFEGARLKYDNCFSKIIAQKYPNKAFLVKNIQIKHFWSNI